MSQPIGGERILSTWTIYDSPQDYPGRIVLRRFGIAAGHLEPIPTQEVYLAETVEQARAMLPPGLFCMGRDRDDDPCIVETWL